MHDFFILVDRNGLGFFLITLALIGAAVRVITTFINRNKPVCDCDCCGDGPDEEEEVVAMGGEEEDHAHK